MTALGVALESPWQLVARLFDADGPQERTSFIVSRLASCSLMARAMSTRWTSFHFLTLDKYGAVARINRLIEGC
jgi:hypothetical protein